MKYVKNAPVAKAATVEPGIAVPQTKTIGISCFAFLLAFMLNSCGLEETFYDNADGGCKIIQDEIICPCTSTADSTLIG
jgi:hypothetical protein